MVKISAPQRRKGCTRQKTSSSKSQISILYQNPCYIRVSTTLTLLISSSRGLPLNAIAVSSIIVVAIIPTVASIATVVISIAAVVASIVAVFSRVTIAASVSCSASSIMTESFECLEKQSVAQIQKAAQKPRSDEQ